MLTVEKNSDPMLTNCQVRNLLVITPKREHKQFDMQKEDGKMKYTIWNLNSLCLLYIKAGSTRSFIIGERKKFEHNVENINKIDVTCWM